VVVPPRRAHAIALQLAHMKEPPTNILPGVATYLRVLEPHHALPAVVPEEVDDLVVKVYPLPDGGARTEVVGRCKDEARAARAADKLRRALSDLLGSFTGAGINFITRGLLNGVDVDSDQNEVRVHLKASEDQLDALLSYVEGQLGIYENGPAPSGGTPPAPR
jgi:hypothetical protein